MMSEKTITIEEYEGLIRMVCSRFSNLLQMDRSLTIDDILSEGYVAFVEIKNQIESGTLTSEYQISTIIGNRVKQRLTDIYNDFQKARKKAILNQVPIEEVPESAIYKRFFLTDLSEAFRQVADAIIDLPEELEKLCEKNKGIPKPAISKYMKIKHGWSDKKIIRFWRTLKEW